MIARIRKPVGLLAAALAFGVVMSVLKGTGGGVRLQAGNISAPWLAIAFVAGALYTQPGRAAGAGLTATLAALLWLLRRAEPLSRTRLSGLLRFLEDPLQMYRFIVTPHLIVFVGGLAHRSAVRSAWRCMGRPSLAPSGRRDRSVLPARAVCLGSRSGLPWDTICSRPTGGCGSARSRSACSCCRLCCAEIAAPEKWARSSSRTGVPLRRQGASCAESARLIESSLRGRWFAGRPSAQSWT